jgi:DNA-binding NtrC family response regulator
MVVDDEPVVCRTLAGLLESEGYSVQLVTSVREAEEEFRQHVPDLAIVDHRLPDGDGLALLGALKAIDRRVPLVMLTGYATTALAVDAVKRGAEQMLAKPIEPSALLLVIERAVDNYRIRRRQDALSTRDVRRERERNPFAGTSDAIRRIAERAHRALESDQPVLIEGETGVGKGVLAGWLHHQSSRADEALVEIRLPSLPTEQMERELFRLIHVADDGTVFLDEITALDLGLQPRLRQIIDDKRLPRTLDACDRAVDVRIVAATNRDIRQLARHGAFSAELCHRLGTLRLSIPPLRDRPEDLPALARDVAAEFGAAAPVELTPAAISAMQAYRWPGNVRELRNVIERAVLLTGGAPQITADDLLLMGPDPDGTAEIRAADLTPDHMLTLDEMERRHVERVVRLEGGSVDRAAVRLGVSRSTLYQKLKRYREDDRRTS